VNAGVYPARGYLLCCIERTGSNLLAEGLSTTRVAGRPIEYFNPVLEQQGWRHELRCGVDAATALDRVLVAGTTPNRVFGAKIHFNHLRHFGLSLQGEWSEARRLAPMNLIRECQALKPGLVPQAEALESLCALEPELQDRLEQAWAVLRGRIPDLRVIWLSRGNQVARAVSHYRARQSGVWWRSSEQPNDTVSCGPDQFDPAEVHALYCLGRFHEHCWQVFFERCGIAPLRLVYEQLVAHYESTVRDVLSWLEVDSAAISIAAPRSRLLADERSRAWEASYRQLASV
jgi:trehalose 2-sulfotransferase